MNRIKILTTAMLLFVCGFVHAQDRLIKGRVTATSGGDGIPYVSVLVKGTTLGTKTDLEGYYSLTAPTKEITLVFTSMGFKTLEMALAEGSFTANATLAEDALMLDEAVVTAIGIKADKKALGYSVQEVKGEDLLNSRENNIVNAISGKVAGVQITSSNGMAGGSSFINIRGAKSIDGENQPLFIVDGVPIDNSMLLTGNPDDGSNVNLEHVAFSNRAIDLNPDDIENVTILKGPAATALYGIRASNGAVVITTKKGKSTNGRGVNVTYSMSATYDKVNKLPEHQTLYAQGQSGVYKGPETGMSRSWGPRLDSLRYDNDKNYPYDKNGALLYYKDSGAVGKTPTPYDNMADFFGTGVTYNHSISLSGGNDVSTFYLSYGNLMSEGIVPKNTFNKNSVKISGETKMSSKFSIAGSANYINSGGTRIEQGSNTSGVMLGLTRTPVTFDNSNGLGHGAVDDRSAYILPDGSQRNYRGGGGYDNPFWTVNQNPLVDDVNRIIGMSQINYTPNEWMNVTYRIGNDFYSDRRKQHLAIGSRNTPAGRMYEDQHFVRDINSDLLVNMNKSFSDDLKGSLTLGNNMYQENYQRIYVQGDGLTIPEFYHMSNAQSVSVREMTSKYRTAAFFADAKIDYKNMVYLDVTGRNEWSTSLPVAKNNFFYPSANLGLIFTEMLGISDNKVLPYGKFRFSWATVGNDASVYSTSTVFTQTHYNDGWTDGIKYPFLGAPGFMKADVLGNSELRPEKTKSLEYGFDLRFLENKIGLDVTMYNTTSSDVILSVPIAASSGYLELVANAAEINNKGTELVLNLKPVSTKDFKWLMDINYSRNKNTVVKLADGVDNIFLGGFEGSSIRAVVGKPYGTIYGQGWLRDDKDNIVIDDDTTSSNYGYPILDGTEKALGDVSPDWLMGVRNTFSYKGFSLSCLLDIRQGGKMWNGTESALYFFGTAKATEDREGTKVFTGVKGHLDADGKLVSTGKTNDIVSPYGQDWLAFGNGNGFFGSNTEDFVQDISWKRLRELTLSYRLDPEWLKKSVFSSCDFSVTGRNIWLKTKYTGVDPETNLMGADNAQGLDYFNMPNTKGWTMGLRLTL